MFRRGVRSSPVSDGSLALDGQSIRTYSNVVPTSLPSLSMTARLRLVTDADAELVPDALLVAWSQWMRARGMAERTITERLRIIGRIAKLATVHPADLDADTITGYLAGLTSAGTRQSYYGAISSWLRWLRLNGTREDDPMLLLGRPKGPRRRPHPIATAHLEVLLASRMHRRTRTMIVLAAYAGLRVHEIAKIRGEDVDLIGEMILVDGKGGVREFLPLHEMVAREALRYPRRGWWFPAYDGDNRPVRANSVSDIVSRAMARAGIPGSAHSLRHWYGTELLRSGADARTTQTLLRHASLATTAIYTLVNDDQRRAAVVRLPHVHAPSA